jgi:hypothetical protein
MSDWYPVARRREAPRSVHSEPVSRIASTEDVTATQASLSTPVSIAGDVFGSMREVFTPGPAVEGTLRLYEEMLIEAG